MLARGLSKLMRKVVLIDLSGGGITSLETVGSKDLPGIFNLLSGAVTFESIVFHDRISPLHVIPAGTIFTGGPHPDFENMAEVMDAISQSYDFVIIDCGDADVDSLQAVTGVDTIIIVSGIGASRSDCKKAQEEFEAAGYKDILQIIPDRVDNDRDALTTA